MPWLLEDLVEAKTLSVIKTLSKDKTKIFHLNSLSKSAKVPVSSTARIIKRLVKKGYAEEMKLGKISVYKWAENKKTKQLKMLMKG
jgi:hypothetical protein